MYGVSALRSFAITSGVDFLLCYLYYEIRIGGAYCRVLRTASPPLYSG